MESSKHPPRSSPNPSPAKPPPARPDPREAQEKELDQELDGTFPASDPLPWSHEVK